MSNKPQSLKQRPALNDVQRAKHAVRRMAPAKAHRPLPGRPRGVKNKTTLILKNAILLAAEEVGDPSKKRDQGGLLGYLKWAARREPKSFLSLLGKVLPLQLLTGDSVVQRIHYTDVRELMQRLEQRGLSLPKFDPPLLDLQVSDDVIDGEVVE